MGERCVCGHNPWRHEVPGFDGECIADDCHCTGYVPRQPAVAQPSPVSSPTPPRPETVEQLVEAARATGDKRALLVIGRIQSLTTELRAIVVAHHARERDAAFVEQIKALPRPSKSRRPRAEGVYTCREGCTYPATTPQGRAAHERNVHQDLDLPCGDCDQRFSTRAARTNYRRLTHPAAEAS